MEFSITVLPGDGIGPEVVAEGRVVNVRPHTAALFITGSTEPIIIGDKAEMRRGF